MGRAIPSHSYRRVKINHTPGQQNPYGLFDDRISNIKIANWLAGIHEVNPPGLSYQNSITSIPIKRQKVGKPQVYLHIGRPWGDHRVILCLAGKFLGSRSRSLIPQDRGFSVNEDLDLAEFRRWLRYRFTAARRNMEFVLQLIVSEHLT